MYALLLNKLTPVVRVATGIVMVMVAGVALYATYQFGKSRLAVDVYRQRLEDVTQDYEDLRHTYNEAVKRTAVTELLVQDGNVCIAIRTADGQERIVNTPYDPKDELFVDYVVVDGRLWIRRVFDERTRPSDGVVIDPELTQVDWNQVGHHNGKAVYRSLSEGRWLVTVTGDGSLGLVKAQEDAQVELVPPPSVKDYPQIERELSDKVEGVSAGEVLQSLVRPKKKP